MSAFVKELWSEVIVIERHKGSKWGSKKRQVERNVMIERSQKLDIWPETLRQTSTRPLKYTFHQHSSRLSEKSV